MSEIDHSTPLYVCKVDSAAEGYLEIFRHWGIEYVFGSPGSEYIPLWEALAKFSSQNKFPRYINARHESLALAMARGYTMATGVPQVVLLHVSFGLLHGAMEIKALFNENIPMIVIAGQNVTHEEEVWGGTPGPHYLAFSEVGGTQRLVQPYVKWCHVPSTNLNINYILSRALRLTMAEPRGPVFLLISRELLFEKLSQIQIPKKMQPPTSIQADPAAINALARQLLSAKNPIIYTRYLGRNPKTVEILVQLAELVSIPVVETPAYVNFPTNHPLHLGYDITLFQNEADMILVIDSSSWPPWYPPNKGLQSSKATITYIDLDPVQVNYPYWGYPADLLITGDSQLVLPALLRVLRRKIKEPSLERRNRYEQLKKQHSTLREKWRDEALAAQKDCPIDPKWFCHQLNQTIDDNTIIVNETITHWRTINRYLENNRVKSGTRFEGAGATASAGLGQGLGVALGLKLAHPNKTIIALEGDGCFHYNPVIPAFGLAQEYNLPFLTIIFDNQAYAAMKHHTRYYSTGYSVSTDTYYGVPQKPKVEYTKLIEAFNGYSAIVEDPNKIQSSIQQALSQVNKGKIALLDVILPEP
jgi:acetolactate synthase-1/2/3 large subunit